ncbi:MAG: T9SS type A sorting domain-containing protein [Chitinophagaceae bacterium]|nr:T9SS type A sorting domain-containing protein [Chitinophagaceae bacterium]
MKRNLLLSVLMLTVTAMQAQRSLPLYAVTSDENNYQWLNLKMIDAGKGVVLKTIFDYNHQQVTVLNAETNTVAAKREEGDGPTGSMVAAAAYSRAQSKFFFIPMRIAELRWADLSKGTTAYYTFTSTVLSKLNMNDAANHFTRMCIGADGNGYAVTNDGNHVIQFSTGKQTKLVDLGNLVDAAANKDISIHTQCTSWGGDMVAGADGNLYIITQRSYIFQFLPKNRIATLLGQIKELPATFTTNGAAVDEEGNLIIACSNGNQPYFKVDMNTLAAKAAFTQTPAGMNASDLASQYLLRKPAENNSSYLERATVAGRQKISMYPNPIVDNRMQLIFDEAEKGEYTIQVMDISGKVLLNKVVNISGPGQLSALELNSTMSKGMYMVKVLNHDLKTVFADKLMVQ